MLIKFAKMHWWALLVLFVGCFEENIGGLTNIDEHRLEFPGRLTNNDEASSEQAKLVVFYTQKSSEIYDLENPIEILNSSRFNAALKTVLYIHGFLDGTFSESVKNVVDAYLERGDHNIIVLDWHTEAEPGYFFNAIPNVEKIGRKTATALLKMINAGLNLETLHLVGHSLGGEMAGVIGRETQRQTGGRNMFKRITALDPAYPGFYEFPFSEHITEKDAEFVDIIHTDAGFYGTPYSTGTVDFWPNGGISPQPGCESWIFHSKDICSHYKSWHYWAESVSEKYRKTFNAVQAKDWHDFQQGKVAQNDREVVMGIECPLEISGNFYLQTNPESPFARGESGMKFDAHL